MADGTAVVARGIAKSFGSGATAVRVLHSLNYSVIPGNFDLILGPSGSGKSTLLNLLGLMASPDEGEIDFLGRPTRKLDEEARARLRGEALGFVFQFDSLLPEFTMLENVTMPARVLLARGAPQAGSKAPRSLAEADARGRELLERLGLAGLSARLPFEASGGERQRVALCRALINRPAVILADEPTGNLDKQNGELVFKDLKRLADAERVAVVMVTHNESAREFAHRVFHMRDGELSQEGARVP